LKLEFKGRGGTDFQNVIDIVNQRHYRGVMILTDGQAPAPTQPKGAHVLWVLPTGCKPPVDWGERVYLEKHA
jgi:predicted metal-dependent peptidase